MTAINEGSAPCWHVSTHSTGKGSKPMLTTLLLLALGVAAFGAFAAYVAFCDRV
ncbi:MAG: hypothetical protein P4L83_16955 [Nevskia sp.]|nr:hypothetical protein [Nevskia sp.]